MEKASRKLISVVLCAAILLSCFVISATAKSGQEDIDYSTALPISVGTTSVTVNDSDSKLYKFVPADSGYYRIRAVYGIDEYVYFDYYEIDDDYITNDLGFNASESERFAQLSANGTYYFSFYGDKIGEKSMTFSVIIEYLGNVQSAEFLSHPYMTLFWDVDCGGEPHDDDEFWIWDESVFFDGKIRISFSLGSTFVFEDYELLSFFKTETAATLTSCTITFFFGNTVRLSYTLPIMENPVESIEIVRTPDKLSYTQYVEGNTYFPDPYFSNYYIAFEPYFDFTGLQIKITYTNGTTETFDAYDSDGCLLESYKGFDLWFCSPESSEVGSNELEVEYAACTDSFTYTVSRAPFPVYIFVFLQGLAEVIGNYLFTWFLY